MDQKTCYYKILNLQNTATKEEIRKAYLKFSLKFHPDKNPDPQAAEIFRNVAEAYKVLSNEESRKNYDTYGFSEQPNMPNFSNFNPKDLFKEMFGTEDVGVAIRNIMSDPELRGPVLMGIGGAVTIGGIASVLSSFSQNSSSSSQSNARRGTEVNRAQAGLGLVGAAGGVTAMLGGAALYAYDSFVNADKPCRTTE